MAKNVEVIEPKLFTGVVADEIVASIRDAISENGRCSLVLSGGSTPGAIYRLLSKPPRIDEIEWEKLTLYWGDERYVPHDHTHSNFRMTSETMLSALNDRKPKICAVATESSDAAAAASEYAKLIIESEKLADGELPVFDIVLLGIGEDGHTASLFPGSPALDSAPGTICVSCEHPDGGQRISLTQHVIFHAKKIFFIVKGAGKAEILKQVLEGNDKPQDIPARYFLNAADRVTFFADSEAAQKLTL